MRKLATAYLPEKRLSARARFNVAEKSGRYASVSIVVVVLVVRLVFHRIL